MIDADTKREVLAQAEPVRLNVCGYLTTDMLEFILEVLSIKGEISVYGVTAAPTLYEVSTELLKGITIKVGESSVIITSNDVNSAKDNS